MPDREPKPRGPGRPPKYPAGTRRQQVPLAEAELAAADRLAARADLSREEWLRLAVLHVIAAGWAPVK